MVKATAKVSTAATVTLKHLAAKLAEDHALPRSRPRRCSAISSAAHQASEEGRPDPPQRSRHPAGPQARRPHGPQSGDGRGHQDQGQQEGRLPRRQGTQGSGLISDAEFGGAATTWSRSLRRFIAGAGETKSPSPTGIEAFEDAASGIQAFQRQHASMDESNGRRALAGASIDARYRWAGSCRRPAWELVAGGSIAYHPQADSHTGRRCRRLQPAHGRGRGRHAAALKAMPARADRSQDRRASRAHRQDDGRRAAGRVLQRRRCGALRRRDPARDGGAQCRRAADDKRIEFRIGINLGDIIVDERRHLRRRRQCRRAARSAWPSPGGICVSRVVRDQVRDKLDLAFEDMGEQQVKNIARPVQVMRVLLDGTVASAAAGGLDAAGIGTQASALPGSFCFLPLPWRWSAAMSCGNMPAAARRRHWASAARRWPFCPSTLSPAMRSKCLWRKASPRISYRSYPRLRDSMSWRTGRSPATPPPAPTSSRSAAAWE